MVDGEESAGNPEFKDFLEYFPDAIVDVIFATLRVTYMNRTARRKLGYTPEDVAAGVQVGQLFDQRTIARFTEYLLPLVVRSDQASKPYERLEGAITLEVDVIRKDGSTFDGEVNGLMILDERKQPIGSRAIVRDISRRKAVEREREALLGQLRQALTEVRQLSGLLPICAWCKRMHTPSGGWSQIEKYVQDNSEASFSHGICPDCASKIAPVHELGGEGQ